LPESGGGSEHGQLQGGASRLPEKLCAYLSIALLIGLGANALFGLWWMDPAAALVIAAVALKEGHESWRGDGCCDFCEAPRLKRPASR
jgi:hypothetical protein